jgi:DNA-binding MarR family transcriptional regulator
LIDETAVHYFLTSQGKTTYMSSLKEAFRNLQFRNEQHKAFTGVVFVASVAEKYLESALAPYKVSPQQFRILRALRKTDAEGISVYTLRDFLIDAKSDISRLVDRLQKSGFVKKRPGKADKRITQVVITPKGLRLLAKIDKHEDEFYKPVDRLPGAQARQLNKLLEVMYQSLTS